MERFRRPGLVRLLLVAAVIAAAVTGVIAAPWLSRHALAQTPGTQNPLDLRPDIYSNGDEVFRQMPHAIPAFVAGLLGVLLLGRLFGLYELGELTTIALIAAIGGIVYKFYWKF